MNCELGKMNRLPLAPEDAKTDAIDAASPIVIV